MSSHTPVASYSLTVRVRIANKPGMLGKVTSAIGEAGGDIGAVDLVEAGQKEMTRDIAFKASDEAHGQRIVDRLRAVPDVTVVNVSDRTFLMHLGGKIEVTGRVAPGYAADLIAVAGDPAERIEALADLKLVLVSGRVLIGA